jgi:hypothetical protein
MRELAHRAGEEESFLRFNVTVENYVPIMQSNDKVFTIAFRAVMFFRIPQDQQL